MEEDKYMNPVRKKVKQQCLRRNILETNNSGLKSQLMSHRAIAVKEKKSSNKKACNNLSNDQKSRDQSQFVVTPFQFEQLMREKEEATKMLMRKQSQLIELQLKYLCLSEKYRSLSQRHKVSCDSTSANKSQVDEDIESVPLGQNAGNPNKKKQLVSLKQKMRKMDFSNFFPIFKKTQLSKPQK